MLLTREILKDVPDGLIVDSCVVIPLPLRQLIKNYNKIALNHPEGISQITEDTTGAQLKEAIARLKAEDRLALLHAYALIAKKAQSSPVLFLDPEKEEQRKLRSFSLSILAIGAGGAFFAIMGAIIALALFGPSRAAGEAVSVFTPLSEIVKIVRYILVPKQ